jgi:pimeloyl-ACP methyl ester carboxylesterase
MLYFDHRGMGLSTPVTAATTANQAGQSAADQARYLKHFRADSAARDLEAIRQCLTANSPPELKKWSVMGQSYGGFVAISYLSRYPDGLKEVFTTGGLPPITVKGPEEVYQRLVEKVQERNRAYFNKFPEDGEKVRTILDYLITKESTNGGVTLSGGGQLTAERFMQIGILFGFHGGLDAVHDIVLTAVNDLEIFGVLTRPTLSRIVAQGSFDDHPLYAVLHEPIYCQGGIAPNWAAERVVRQYPNFETRSNSQKVYFTGEMVFKHNFAEYPELVKLAPAAMLLADMTDWPELYDIDQLKRNEVPVYSSTYVDDMYVDFDFAQETAALIQGCKTFVTNVLYHDAPRSRSEELMKALFALKEDWID